MSPNNKVPPPMLRGFRPLTAGTSPVYDFSYGGAHAMFFNFRADWRQLPT